MLGGLAQVEDPYTAPYDRSMMRTNPSYQPRSLVISPPSRPSPGCVRGGCLAQIAREENHCYDLCDEGDYDEKECEEMCSEYKEAQFGGLAQIGSPKKGNDIITDVLEVKDTKP
jgi:hypothetical protein